MTGQLLVRAVRGIDLEKRPCKMVVVFRLKNVVYEIKELDVVRKLERVILYIIWIWTWSIEERPLNQNSEGLSSTYLQNLFLENWAFSVIDV